MAEGARFFVCPDCGSLEVEADAVLGGQGGQLFTCRSCDTTSPAVVETDTLEEAERVSAAIRAEARA